MMTDTLEFSRIPSLPGLYLRGAFRFGRKPPGKTFEARIPKMRATVSAVATDLGRLARYRKICGFADDGYLPLPYPQVMATPLAAAMVMGDRFPYPVAGVVHVRQQITQHEPIAPRAVLSIESWIADERQAARGVEFDTAVEIRHGEQLVWESISTALIRSRAGQQKGGAKKTEPRPEPPKWDHQDTWKLGEDLGRRYAAVTHDYNPIHLHALTAKPFGFKRAIIHGMWSLARATAALRKEVPPNGMKLDVSFTRPIFLPAKVNFVWRRDGDGVAFAVLDRNGERTHLRGTLG